MAERNIDGLSNQEPQIRNSLARQIIGFGKILYEIRKGDRYDFDPETGRIRIFGLPAIPRTFDSRESRAYSVWLKTLPQRGGVEIVDETTTYQHERPFRDRLVGVDSLEDDDEDEEEEVDEGQLSTEHVPHDPFEEVLKRAGAEGEIASESKSVIKVYSDSKGEIMVDIGSTKRTLDNPHPGQLAQGTVYQQFSF